MNNMARMYEVGSHKTSVFTEGGWTKVVYHNTVVVKFNRDKIVLDSGKWFTMTTKTRMNQASNQYGLGFTVFQKDFEWFVDYKGKTYRFSDGMVLKR